MRAYCTSTNHLFVEVVIFIVFPSGLCDKKSWKYKTPTEVRIVGFPYSRFFTFVFCFCFFLSFVA